MDKILKKLIKFIKKNPALILILAIGLFLRFFHLKELFGYGHDQDLAGWFVRDVVVNKHFRLIGQVTSTEGIFIGGLYYYLLIPFYLIFNMDPLGGEVLVILIGILTIFSFWYVFQSIHGKKVGLIAAFIYAVSYYTVMNDKEMVPTMPVLLWSVWFYFAVMNSLQGKFKLSLPIFAVLLSLIWHMNFALILLTPLIPLSIWLSHKKINIRLIINSFIILIVTSLPLIIFELRHHFIQSKALITALTATNQNDIYSGGEKWMRVIYLASKNLNGLLLGDFNSWDYRLLFIFLIAVFLVCIWKKQVGFKQGLLIGFWILLQIAFFALYSKRVSEYYLNGTLVIFIAIIAFAVGAGLRTGIGKLFSLAFLFLFLITNIIRLVTYLPNQNGYLEKTALVNDIRNETVKNSYTCIAVSYITDPGYELGYRYLFWLKGLRVNHPQTGLPVYTIVFPMKSIFPTNKSFGSLGLIYPPVNLYTIDGVRKSCGIENLNETEAMYGLPI